MRVVFQSFVIFSVIFLAQLGHYSGLSAETIAADKGMHFGVSAASHMTCSLIAKELTRSQWGSKIGCWMLVNAAGVVKEMTDPMRKGTRDVNDVYANMAGSGMSFVTLSLAF